MATSITTLALDIAAEDSVAAAKLVLAPLAKVAKSFNAAEGEVGDTVKVPVFANATASDFAAGSNDYTTATSAGVSGKSIELNAHPFASYRLMPDDAMETAAGRDWIRQTTISTVKAVAKAVVSKVLVEGMKNGTGSLTISGANAKAKVAGIRKACVTAGINPGEASLLLPSALYTDLISELPVETIGVSDAIVNGRCEKLFGFGYIAELQDEVSYTNASSKKVTLDAMVLGPDALGFACRLPIIQNAGMYDVSDVTDDQAGIAIRVRSNGAVATDARFLGAEVICGAKALKPAEILVASTTAS